MRALSERELELIVGGYDSGGGGAVSYTPEADSTGYNVDVSDDMATKIANDTANMSEAQAADYASASAESLGLGKVKVKGVEFWPFGKKKKFKIKLGMPC